jgi:hypothetical protein
LTVGAVASLYVVNVLTADRERDRDHR